MDKLVQLKKRILIIKNRFGLRNKDFTIISNNCWGGFIYQKFGIQYNTPFIGVFVYAEDYINLLKNLKQINLKQIRFIEHKNSKYFDYAKNERRKIDYPVGVVGNNIEIHFLHYKSELEAYEKWTRRTDRINLNNLILKFSDRDLCNYKLIKEFDDLDFVNKICFTAKDYPEFKSCICLDEFIGEEYVEAEWLYHENYINIKQYMNQILFKYKR